MPVLFVDDNFDNFAEARAGRLTEETLKLVA
jgi:hypothetical protein